MYVHSHAFLLFGLFLIASQSHRAEEKQNTVILFTRFSEFSKVSQSAEYMVRNSCVRKHGPRDRYGGRHDGRARHDAGRGAVGGEVRRPEGPQPAAAVERDLSVGSVASPGGVPMLRFDRSVHAF